MMFKLPRLLSGVIALRDHTESLHIVPDLSAVLSERVDSCPLRCSLACPPELVAMTAHPAVASGIPLHIYQMGLPSFWKILRHCEKMGCPQPIRISL